MTHAFLDAALRLAQRSGLDFLFTFSQFCEATYLLLLLQLLFVGEVGGHSNRSFAALGAAWVGGCGDGGAGMEFTLLSVIGLKASISTYSIWSGSSPLDMKPCPYLIFPLIMSC